MRSDGANHLNGTNSVSDRHHFVLVNSPLAGPDAPLAVDGAGRIHQNTVEIEENCGAVKSGHRFF
jgi:hypothetical protein